MSNDKQNKKETWMNLPVGSRGAVHVEDGSSNEEYSRESELQPS